VLRLALKFSKGEAQRRGELLGEFRHGIGIAQETAPSRDGSEGDAAGFRFRQASSKTVEISETLPCGPARGDGIRAFPPRCETSGEGILLLVNLEQLGVAAEHLEVANFSGVWLFRPRGLATGGVREGEQGF